MKKLLTLFIQKTTIKHAVLYTALFAALSIVINASDIGLAGLMKITGGAGILDVSLESMLEKGLGFSHDEAFEMLSALGADGRTFYLTRISPLDFPFPVAYSLFYAGWIAFFIKHTTTREWVKYLLLIAFLSGLFDWIENIGIIALVTSYPILPAWAVFTGSAFGILKALFTIAATILTVIMFILFIAGKVRSKTA